VFRRRTVEDSFKTRRCEMALVFHRGLALPLWAAVFFAVALTASPPATPFLIAVLGIAVIIFAVGGLVPQLRAARSVVHVVTHEHDWKMTRPPD
jgi:hypothetical protein